MPVNVRLSAQRVFVAVILFLSLPIATFAAIRNGADAIGGLGQYGSSGTGLVPYYDSAAVNGAPNPLGLYRPTDVLVDATGQRIFVVDAFNNRILVFKTNADSSLTDIYPDYVLGQSNFNTTAMGLGTATGLARPHAVALDSAGQRLFVADSDNNRVVVFDVTEITNGEAAVAVLGQPNFTSNATARSATGLSAPFGVTYDATGNRIFVSDGSNERIMVFDVAEITNGEAAVNVIGQTSFTAYAVGTSTSVVNDVFAATLDETNGLLYMTDSSNHRVLVFDISAGITNGMGATHVLGQTNFTNFSSGLANNRLNFPRGLGLYPGNQRLFVSDSNNERVLVFDVSTIINGEAAVNVLGQADFISNTPQATQAGLNFPHKMSFSADGALTYVPDYYNNRVVVYNTSVITDGEDVVGLLGQYDVGSGGLVPLYTGSAANGVSTVIGMNWPAGIVLDETRHRLFVADKTNNRVLVHLLNNDDTLPDYVPDYVLGQADFLTVANGRSQNQLTAPQGLTYDSDNQLLFVADSLSSRVMVFDVTTITNGMNAAYVLGQADFISLTAVAAQNRANYTYGIDYDAGRQWLCVAERNNNRVTIFDFSGGITNGMNASYVLGQADYTSTGAATTQSGMSWPHGCAFGDDDRLFVSDRSNNRVLVYDLGTIANGMNASYVLGQADYTSAGSSVTQSSVPSPHGLRYDHARDRLFVANTAADRISVFDRVGGVTDNMSASYVLGQADFTSFTGATSQSKMLTPFMMEVNSAGTKLYVSDHDSGNRILIFDVSPQTSSSVASATVQQCLSPTISLSSPNGGETLKADATVQVFWSAGTCGTTGVRLSLSTDGGQTFTHDIGTASDVGGGFYNWSVPSGLTTDKARLRLELLGSGGVVASDDSDANFSVIDPNQPEPTKEDVSEEQVPETVETTDTPAEKSTPQSSEESYDQSKEELLTVAEDVLPAKDSEELAETMDEFDQTKDDAEEAEQKVDEIIDEQEELLEMQRLAGEIIKALLAVNDMVGERDRLMAEAMIADGTVPADMVAELAEAVAVSEISAQVVSSTSGSWVAANDAFIETQEQVIKDARNQSELRVKLRAVADRLVAASIRLNQLQAAVDLYNGSDDYERANVSQMQTALDIVQVELKMVRERLATAEQRLTVAENTAWDSIYALHEAESSTQPDAAAILTEVTESYRRAMRERNESAKVAEQARLDVVAAERALVWAQDALDQALAGLESSAADWGSTQAELDEAQAAYDAIQDEMNALLGQMDVNDEMAAKLRGDLLKGAQLLSEEGVGGMAAAMASGRAGISRDGLMRMAMTLAAQTAPLTDLSNSLTSSNANNMDLAQKLAKQPDLISSIQVLAADIRQRAPQFAADVDVCLLSVQSSFNTFAKGGNLNLATATSWVTTTSGTFSSCSKLNLSNTDKVRLATDLVLGANNPLSQAIVDVTEAVTVVTDVVDAGTKLLSDSALQLAQGAFDSVRSGNTVAISKALGNVTLNAFSFGVTSTVKVTNMLQQKTTQVLDIANGASREIAKAAPAVVKNVSKAVNNAVTQTTKAVASTVKNVSRAAAKVWKKIWPW